MNQQAVSDQSFNESMLTVSLVTDEQAFLALKVQWEQLEKNDPLCTPFNTWCWLSLWWQHYSEHRELKIITVYQGDQLVGIAPLYVQQYKVMQLLSNRILKFIGSGGNTAPDYLNFLAQPEWRDTVIDVALNEVFSWPDWHELQLNEIVADSLLAKKLPVFLQSKTGHKTSVVEQANYIASLPESWEEYRMSISRKRRKAINHRNNRLDQAGEWSLYVCESQQQLEEGMDALVALHRLRWESKGEAGGFNTDEYVAFHRAVIQTFYDRGEMWLLCLKLNDEIIGVQYIFNYAQWLMFFQSGFSPDHEPLSPGHVMFTWAIEQGIASHLNGIDMLKGNYMYKTAYAKEELTTQNFRHVRGGLHRAIYQVKQKTKSALHNH